MMTELTGEQRSDLNAILSHLQANLNDLESDLNDQTDTDWLLDIAHETQEHLSRFVTQLEDING